MKDTKGWRLEKHWLVGRQNPFILEAIYKAWQPDKELKSVKKTGRK